MQRNFRKETEKIIRKIRNAGKTGMPSNEQVAQEMKVQQNEPEVNNHALLHEGSELEKSRKRFSDLFEHAPVGYLLLEKNFRIAKANFAATQMLSCEKSKLEGKLITKFIHPDYQEIFDMHCRQVLESDNLHTEEIKFRKSAVKYVSTQIQSVKDSDPSTRELLIRMAIIDISQRKGIEKDLKRFRAAIDSSADHIFLINLATNRFLDVNESACRKIGIPREEILHMRPENLNPRYTQAFIKNLLSDAQGNITRESRNLETRHTLKNGEVIDLEILLRYIPIDDEEIVVAVARDISERKSTEERLARIAQELQELNAGKDRFLSIISHDLRGPFLGIKGYTQLLIEDYDLMDRDEIMDYLHNIHESTRDLYTLVDNLLKWSRLELGKMPYDPMPFNLNLELESLIKILSGMAAKKDIRLENLIRKDITPMADRLMVISVVQNLISNAIKFTNKGGRIKLRSHTSSGMITISVEDNGIGIKPEMMDKIFSLDKTYTSRGTAGEKGTGFGLLIAREMVHKMGGELWAESQPGKGSVFSFTLKNAS